jgi:hypothetical protein
MAGAVLGGLGPAKRASSNRACVDPGASSHGEAEAGSAGLHAFPSWHARYPLCSAAAEAGRSALPDARASALARRGDPQGRWYVPGVPLWALRCPPLRRPNCRDEGRRCSLRLHQRSGPLRFLPHGQDGACQSSPTGPSPTIPPASVCAAGGPSRPRRQGRWKVLIAPAPAHGLQAGISQSGRWDAPLLQAQTLRIISRRKLWIHCNYWSIFTSWSPSMPPAPSLEAWNLMERG